MNPAQFFCGLFTAALLSSSSLQAAPPDVAGSWKWDFEQGGEKREIGMKLKQDGASVSGAITGPDGTMLDVREGKVSDDGKVTFFIELERDGNTMKINFAGKTSGDTITGNIKYINPEGEAREREWNAKREGRKREVSGEYRSSFKRQDGTAMESTLRLKQAGESITGSNVGANGNEVEIQDGKVQGQDISFRILRERDGRTVTARYRGKIQEDGSIKGFIESDWTGEIRRMDWEAKKAP